MDEAFREVVGHAAGTDDAADTALWNAGWDLARHGPLTEARP
jgi:hypothetical protein